MLINGGALLRKKALMGTAIVENGNRGERLMSKISTERQNTSKAFDCGTTYHDKLSKYKQLNDNLTIQNAELIKELKIYDERRKVAQAKTEEWRAKYWKLNEVVNDLHREIDELDHANDGSYAD
jgi:uncharacterized coiled-coil DUF342 family protein